MKILDRYLGRSFLRSWLSVNLVLAGLLSFLELAKQLDHVGEGHYRLTDALFYVALTLPGRMLELTPTSALLGSMVALGLAGEKPRAARPAGERNLHSTGRLGLCATRCSYPARFSAGRSVHHPFP